MQSWVKEYLGSTSADLPAACQISVKRLSNVVFKSFTQAGGGGGGLWVSYKHYLCHVRVIFVQLYSPHLTVQYIMSLWIFLTMPGVWVSCIIRSAFIKFWWYMAALNCQEYFTQWGKLTFELLHWLNLTFGFAKNKSRKLFFPTPFSKFRLILDRIIEPTLVPS